MKINKHFHFLGPLVIATLSLCALISASMNSCSSTPTSCVPDTVLRHDTLRDTVHVRDTTSHAFTWYVDTLGDGALSDLYDVWVFDENNIWVVGELEISGGGGNCAHWGGKKWEVKKIRVWFQSVNDTVTADLYGIYAFSSTDIWLMGGNVVIHGDGSHWVMVQNLQDIPGFDSVSVSRAWGTSSNDIYFCGYKGSLVHYDGTTFKKIETGTKANINDIWGIIVDSTGKQNILCAVSNEASSNEKKFLRINPSQLTVETLSWSPKRELQGVWFKTMDTTFTAGDGVFVGKPGSWIEQAIIPYNYTQGVRGNANNDVFAVGAFGLCTHYSGRSWRNYPEVALSRGRYSSVAYKGNFVIAVGDNQQGMQTRAIIARGYRK